MLRPITEYLKARLRKRLELVPLGFSPIFGITIDVAMVLIVAVATLQRPSADLLVCVLAIVVACSPDVVLFFSGISFKASIIWTVTMVSTAIFLFGTATPIPWDFAPLLLTLGVGTAVALSPVLVGVWAAGSAAALLILAAQLHNLDGLVLYLPILGMGWLVGLLMRVQQQLIVKQHEAQVALAEHAAADERRRIAREVHDVIAHSLSITLLHLTGARRELQVDGDSAEAVESLQQAEQLGRQAMADIRRTVGLLDGGPMGTNPEPGIDDIAGLVEDFRRAGLDVDLRVNGPTSTVSAAVGLALYRITQESLANVAKHASDLKCSARVLISTKAATVTVTNRCPAAVRVAGEAKGRGVPGMQQRVELLGGTIEAGPNDGRWQVRASIPLDEPTGFRPPWCRE